MLVEFTTRLNQMDQKESTTQKITIQGITYPLCITMGAFLEFHRLTGREVTELKTEHLSDTITLLHCILKAGQKRQGYSYPYETADDLACQLTPEDMQGIKLV